MVKTINQALKNFKNEILRKKPRLNAEGYKPSFALDMVTAYNEVYAMASVLGLTQKEQEKILQECGIIKDPKPLSQKKNI